jgi:hypothetical protein
MSPLTDDTHAMIPVFLAFLQKNRQAGGFNAVPFDANGQPNEEALQRSIQTKVMVRIELNEEEVTKEFPFSHRLRRK